MNPRIALAAMAALSILIAPAEAKKAQSQNSPPIDIAAIPPYPTDEMPGAASGRRGLRSTKAIRTARYSGKPVSGHQRASYEETRFLPHPAGCPRRAFCACGAAVKVFGQPIRELWPVRAWHQFASDAPARGNVAIERRRSHLFVLDEHVGGTIWMVYDYNSGGHKSRRHERDIAGLKIVNPHTRTFSAKRRHVASTSQGKL